MPGHTDADDAGLSRLFALSRDLFCVADADGHFRYVNPAWEQQFGWSLDELRSRPFLEFVHPDDVAPTLAQYEAQKGGGHAISFSNRYRHRDGTHRWLEWNATPVGPDGFIYAVARDVTERRRAEAEIRALNEELRQHVAELQRLNQENEAARVASDERWRLLFDRNPNLMWVYDPGTLRFLAVNDAAVQHYGYTRDEFLAMTIADIRPAEEVPALLENVAHAPAGLEVSGEWRHRRKDGTLIDVEIRSHALRYEGRPAKLVLAHDISIHAVLRHVNQELEAFTYSVSHDLRSPLRHIAGFAELLQKHAAAGLDAKGRRYLETIRTSAAHMGKLIDDLLAFSRIGRAELQLAEVRLDDVVRGALTEAEEELGDREVQVVVGPLPAVRGDRSLLHLVMVNLISNALKYTRTRRAGRGRDRGRGGEGERGRDLRAGQRGGLRHAVRGQAVRRLSAAAQLGRVRGNRHRSGQRAAHRAPARGARVGGSRDRSRRDVLCRAAPRGRQWRVNVLRPILLVEDNANDLELMLEALREHNLANPVDVARDGVQALAYLRREGAYAARAPLDPVVVLLDLKMPRMDGLEVLRVAKADARLQAIPIVMVTSSREERDLVESYHLGVNAYVVKPVDFQGFAGAVRQLGAFWAVLNEPPPNGTSP